MTQSEREQTLLKTFAIKHKRPRYFELAGSVKGREKIRNALDHFKDLDPSRCKLIPPQNQKAAEIIRLLRNLGAADVCYVFSSNPLVDGSKLALEVALKEIVGYGFGTFVCCIPGLLAYFEAEDPGARFLCAVSD